MSKSEIQITQGALLKNITRFAIPIVLSNILQITFNAADVAVVGRFCGSDAVASVGATTALLHLFLNIFMGLSAGITIAVSYSLSKKNYDDTSSHVHNAIALALVAGFVIGILAIFLAKPILSLMGTPAGTILDGAVVYFRIYFIGAPVYFLYNFGAAILKANGDSKHPFIYLTIGGIINVILNLFFVLVLKMTVEGVAIATVIANLISAGLIVRNLINFDGPCHVVLKEIKIYKKKLFEIFKLGFPASIQNCMFSIPNIMIQSSVNIFGPAAIAGNTAAANISGYYEIANVALSETTLTFVAHNYGAGLYKRVGKICKTCVWWSAVITILLGTGAYLLSEPLLSIFVPNNEQAIEYGTIKLFYLAVPAFIMSIMNILTSTLRGISKPVFPMLTTIFCVCVIRIIWLMTIFPLYPVIECVFITYPITWSIASIVLYIYYLYHYKKLLKSETSETSETLEEIQ